MPKEFDRKRSPLGAVLISLRRKYGNVSQAELARRTADVSEGPVSSGHIALIETGDRGASYNTVMALGMALRLREDDFDRLLMAAGIDPERSPAERQELADVTASMQDLLDDATRLQKEAEAGAASGEKLRSLEEELQNAHEELRALARRVVDIIDRYDAEKERQRRANLRRPEAPPTQS